MPDATITSTASTFGTITGTFAADQSTVTGAITGTVAGTLTGSVGVPGPAGPAGAGVPAGGTAGQYLQKTTTGVDYATDWVTLNLSAYAPLNSPVFTGDPQAPTAALGDNDTSLATTAFVQQELASGVAVAKNLEVYVRNQTGSTIPAGSIVYISGATGNRPLITLAQANNDANSAQTMGFTKTAIANNGFGYVIVRGELENIDTSALTEGAQLYLSPTVAGTWTTTKPSAPQHLVYVGIVVRAHPTLGTILVAVQNGYELNELHDVAITSPTNGQVLKYNSSTNLWVNGTDVGGVAWGGITGTLSSQTDLQTALDGKYSTSNPAGYITSSALSPYLLSSTAASTYYLQTNPAGYITSAALTGYATESFVTSQGYITSAALTPYLTSATAASTYQTLAGMSSYLTTATAASTYAPIASPTFTGTVTIPGGASISGYLTTSSAASTYQTIAGMSSYLTTSTAASTYALKTDGALKGNFTLDGTAASPNSDGSILIGSSSTGYSYLNLQAGVIQGVTYSGGNKSFTLNGLEGLKLFSSGQGVRFPDATTQTTAYPGSSGFLLKADNLSGLASTSTARTNLGLGTMATATAADYSTTTVANGLYYPLSSNPAGYLTTAPVTSVAGKTGAVTLVVGDVSGAAPTASPTLTGTPLSTTAAVDTNTTQIATTAFVVGQAGSASPVMDGAATVGTSLRYSREDHVHPTDTSRAPLASPALTGTPTAPTATAGTNTTQIATTAFVQQEVPAASTTAAGKVELATLAEIITGTDTALVMPVSQIPVMTASPYLRSLAAVNFTSVSGSGAVTASSGLQFSREAYLTSTASGRASFQLGNPGQATAQASFHTANFGQINFSNKIVLSGTTVFGISGYAGNANTQIYVTLGGYAGAATGDMTQKGIGIKRVGGTSSAIQLIAHNGTSQTAVSTGITAALAEAINWTIYSDGTGNVTLYINGSQAATTSAGPTGTNTSGNSTYREQVECPSGSGAAHSVHSVGGWVYIRP